jgi:hypothetical protein
MMESVSDTESNQHVNIIIRLLEEDNTLSNVIIPLQNKPTKNYCYHCHLNFKKYLLALFIVGYVIFLCYTFHILFLKNTPFKHNVWFCSFIITSNNIISFIILLFYYYKPWKNIKYYLGLSCSFGIILIGWGLYELFRVKIFILTPLFTLFCILLLTNISLYSSLITWLIFHISG